MPLLRDLGGRWEAWFARFGGSPPARYVAAFDDTDALQRAAVEGMGVGLGRLTMARPLLESGRLVALTRHRLPDSYAHHLVYPPEVGEPSGAGRLPDLGARRRPRERRLPPGAARPRAPRGRRRS